MERTTLAVVAVALLCATAGCGGVFGGDGTSTRSPYGVSATPTPTPTATPTPVATPGSPPPTPAPEFWAAVGSHDEALRAAGNFTVRTSQRIGTIDDGSPPVRRLQVYAVDLDAERYALSVANESGDPVVVLYQTGAGVYQRAGEEWAFANVTGGTGGLDSSAESFLAVENFSIAEYPLERNGTATVGGEELARYTASGPGSYPVGSDTRLRTATAFRATVLVDDRGIVRRVGYAVRGENFLDETFVRIVEFEIAEIGATTVPRPEGIPNATDGG